MLFKMSMESIDAVRASRPRLLLGAWALVLLLGCSAVSGAPATNHCAVDVWAPQGRTPSTGKWGVFGVTSRFLEGPCLQVSGIGSTQSYLKTFYVIDRTDVRNTYMPLGQGLAFAEEVTAGRAPVQRPLNVITNTFCSAGLHLPDGTFLSVGGNDAGASTLRALKPCTDGRCDFTLAGDMATFRWYPSVQLLPDGRAAFVGGATSGSAINYANANNPTIEYYPRAAGETKHNIDFLKRSLPYNLYPFVHLLPSGRLFIFAGNSYILYDTAKNAQVGPDVPLQRKDSQGSDIFRNYPVTGSSALLPLGPRNQYTAEVMICGGSSAAASSYTRADPQYPADSWCYRIKPEVDGATWTAVKMAVPRVMPNAVLLPDGNVLIINGASKGYQGLGPFFNDPALRPEIYSPVSSMWRRNLVASQVPRLYHSSALLAHDGSVFVSGSNPHYGIRSPPNEFPTEFRSEFFHPPYMMRKTFPTVTKAPPSVAINTDFDISVRAPATAKDFKVTLCHPGFSTHSFNQGMRNVELQVKSVTGSGQYAVTVTSPPSKSIAPPTWYWFFVLVDGVPNREGTPIFIQ